MSYFFFDLFDGQTTLKDDVGFELADVNAAFQRAQEIVIREVEQVNGLVDTIDPRELRVRASAGRCVAKVAFRYVSL